MGIGCWLRRVVVGPGGWESPRRPWAGGRRQGRHSRSPGHLPPPSRQLGCGGQLGSLWSTLHLWPASISRLSTAACMSWSFLAYMRVCTHGRSSRACPAVRVAQCVGVRGPMCMCTSHCTLMSSSLHVCPCTSTSSGDCPSPHLLVVGVSQDPAVISAEDDEEQAVLGEEHRAQSGGLGHRRPIP